ncbi:hypothetical protein II810_01280, partial [bacterium]|nr:hypothetical protein [bacterium]
MFYNSSNEYNDCTAHGACSIAPDISSMYEIMLILFRQISFYIINLKAIGIDKSDTIYSLIEKIASIDNIKELSQSQILDLLLFLYNDFQNCKNEYKNKCKSLEIKPKSIKNIINITPQTSISTILKLGEKEFLNKYKNKDTEKKYLQEILVSVIRSTAINLLNFKEFSCDCSDTADMAVSGLNLLNLRISAQNIKLFIDKLALCNIELLSRINRFRQEKFGMPQTVEVSLSTRQNKAIMVSGNNLNDLSNLLEYTKDKDIDIYTNGSLLIAHTYPYFRNFKNLIGHFGNDVINTMLDFATFPGAILLTKNEIQNIEYLYRGRLFSTDNIIPVGISKLKNKDFQPLIESALQAKGFAKGQTRTSKIVGYNIQDLDTNLDKLISNNPKNIYIIGFSDLRADNLNYFKSFFSDFNDNDCAISFSYNPNKNNVLH